MQAVRSQHHQNDEKYRNEHPSQLQYPRRQRNAQALDEAYPQKTRKNSARDTAHAPDDDDHEKVYRLQKIEIRRVEKGVEVRVETSRNTSQKNSRS